MSVYKIIKHELLPLREVKIDLEKSIQTLVEGNLAQLFGLQFVQTEFALKNLRIDTLAFNESTKSFVIIEYKKERNISVIDQGYAYLALLLNNQADFVLEYNERVKKELKKADIDWSQSRVLFVSSAFTKYQKEAMGFKDLPIELWEVKLYENDLMTLNEITPSEKNESINVVKKGDDARVVERVIKQYTIEDHIKSNMGNTRTLFENLSERIMEIDARFDIHPTKFYIAFAIEGKNIIQITPKVSKINLDLLRVEPKDLKDPEKRVTYMNNSYKWYSQHVSQFEIKSEDDIDYAIMLIKQVYKKIVNV